MEREEVSLRSGGSRGVPQENGRGKYDLVSEADFVESGERFRG